MTAGVPFAIRENPLLPSPSSPAELAGEPTEEPTATEPTLRGTGSGTLSIKLTDQNGRGAADIPIVLEGPSSLPLTTNNEGIARVDLPAGTYSFRVEGGCTPTLQVLGGASGRAGVVGGQTVKGSLAIEWKHRYAPGPPAFSSVTPYWPPGDVVTIRFDVLDRCNNRQRTAGASYPTFVFEAGPNLSLAEKPNLTSDAEGYGYVKVKCSREGTAELAAVDSRNPTDRFDIVRSDASGGAATPSCREP